MIRFRDEQAKRRALGWLAGRFSFKSWNTGEMLLPEEALADLHSEGIAFERTKDSLAYPSEDNRTDE